MRSRSTILFFEKLADLECDANHACHPKERVIIRRLHLQEVRRSWWWLRSWRHTLCPKDVTGCQGLGQECVQPRGTEEVCGRQEKGRKHCDSRRQKTDDQEPQEIIDHMNMKQKELLTTMERKQTMMCGALGEFGRNSSRKSWSWRTGSRRRKLSCLRKMKK